MKKSELKQIIKEELKKILEEDVNRQKTRKVMFLMKQSRVPANRASLNFITNFAEDKGIDLNSNEIVHISDNYFKTVALG